MPLIPDVLVVGGGVVGAACARALALAGASVSIMERREVPGEAWRASAGMLAAQVESDAGGALFPLGLAGRGFYRRNAGALRDTTGIDIGLMECGILELISEEHQLELATSRVAAQRQQGHRADLLSPDDVADGWPWLGPCLGAAWAPDDAAVAPDRLVAALRADAIRLGARVVEDTAIELIRQGDALVGVTGSSGPHAAGTVVIAAGAWSGKIGKLPRPLSVEPVRGQMLSFSWPEGIPAAVVYGDHCYLLRRGNDMLVGATMEHAGFDATVSESALVALQARAARSYPPLAGMHPSRRWAGLRPGTPDGLPIIGAEPRLRGLWYATGHGRNGILLAGITGELLARELAGEDLGEALTPFRASRFWDW